VATRLPAAIHVDWLTTELVLTHVWQAVYSGNVTADGGSPTPYLPPGGPFATPPGPSVPPPPAFGSGGGRRSRSGGVAIALGGVAVVLAVAALVVALARSGESSAPATLTAQLPTASTAAPSADTVAADKALCEAISPLMAESADIGKRFVNLGHTGTPERDAGIPQFQAAVEDWAKRIQPIADAHSDPPRYLTRTLQRYIDDTRLYAASIRPGPETDFDRAAWADRVVSYGGPFSECPKVGVQWW
jgi:hypothetical protein